MENNRDKQGAPNPATQEKVNPISNSSPVQDNSSPDIDKHQGSPRSNEENDRQAKDDTTNR
jgi:hypothetical protein